MGDLYWVGGAAAVAEVVTIALTAYDASTTYKITIGGTNGAPSVVISTPGTGGTTTTTATALAAAWNASTHPYCTGVTALASTNTVTLTADTAGVPFVVTSSVSGGTGTIGAATTATASSGPNDWSTAANWSSAAVPVNGDNVYVKFSTIPILWGLAQSAVTPSLLEIELTMTGQVGLPAGTFTVSNGTLDTTVPEYRQDYLAIGAAVVRLGEDYSSTGAGGTTGAALVKVDTGTTNTAWQIYATGSSADALPAVRVKNTNASSTLKIYGGTVGACCERPTETGQFSEIDVYAGGGTQGAADVSVGQGVTVGTHYQLAGTGVLRKAPTTLKIESGATVTVAPVASGQTISTLEKRGELVLAGQDVAITVARG